MPKQLHFWFRVQNRGFVKSYEAPQWVLDLVTLFINMYTDDIPDQSRLKIVFQVRSHKYLLGSFTAASWFYPPFTPVIRIYDINNRSEQNLAWTLAHELGHYLHYIRDPKYYEQRTHVKEREKFAEEIKWALMNAYLHQESVI